MDLSRLKGDLNGIARMSGRGRSNTSVDVLSLTYGVEIFFCTHKLGNLNICLYNAVGELCNELFLIMNMLGTDTDDNLFINIRYKAVFLVLGLRQFDFILNTGTGLGVLRAELNKVGSSSAENR